MVVKPRTGSPTMLIVLNEYTTTSTMGITKRTTRSRLPGRRNAASSQRECLILFVSPGSACGLGDDLRPRLVPQGEPGTGRVDLPVGLRDEDGLAVVERGVGADGLLVRGVAALAARPLERELAEGVVVVVAHDPVHEQERRARRLRVHTDRQA